MIWLRRLLAAALLAYAGLVVALFVKQRDLIYPRNGHTRKPWGPVVTTPAGLPAIEVPGSPMVAFFHGNGHQIASLPFLTKLGTGLLVAEYPGYGGAPGEPTEDSILGAARSAVSMLDHAPVC